MSDGSRDGGGKAAFFTTLPGILTGVAALITAVATLAGVVLTRGGDGGSSTTAPANTPPKEAEGRIAFVRNNSGSNDIFSANAHGGDVRPLATSDRSDTKPSWSPDGTQLAYASSF